MALETPIVTYSSITINGVSIALSGSCKASFNPPYNRIDVTIIPTSCSLSYYEVRVTKADAAHDIGVGALAYWATNLAKSQAHDFQIPVNSSVFSEGDGDYRISLYARNAIDGSWDVTYLLFTVGGELFKPSDSSGFEVLTVREEPTRQ